MRKVILDTDMGIDCDDAVALALLLNAHKNKLCELIGVTASTAREGAISTINAIIDYYEVDKTNIQLGKLLTPLMCDSINNYAKAVMDKFQKSDEAIDATITLRKLLSESPDMVDIVAIGPLTNMNNLLNSKGDEYSPLSGKELIKSKVRKIYVMGGAFEQQEFGEWNLLQDINSAKDVIRNWPTEMVLSPHEVGYKIQTYMKEDFSNPVWYSMYSFAINNHEKVEYFSRYSWDPITCMYALEIYDNLFDLSPFGDIEIDDKAITQFVSNSKNNRRYITTKSNLKGLEETLNKIIER